MRAWMVMGAAMLVGVGAPGSDRVVPLPVYAAEQAAGEAAKVLADMRAALGGAKVEQVKTLSVEGPFRREMGQRQMEGTVVMVLQGPDKMHKSEDTEFPGGASIERIVAVANGTSWEDTQNRGGMGGGMQIMMRGPGGAQMDEAQIEKMRTARLHRGDAALDAGTAGSAGGRSQLCRRRRIARRQGRHARDEGRARPGPALVRGPADAPAADAGVPGGAPADDDAGRPGRTAGGGGPGGGGVPARPRPAALVRPPVPVPAALADSARPRRRSGSASPRCRRRRRAPSR